MNGEGIWYDWVRVPGPPDRQPLDWRRLGHHRLEPDAWSGRLHLRITCLAPVHAGTGDYNVDAGGQPVLAVARRGGRPVLPGAAFKGVVRAVAEAVSRSCGPHFPACPDGMSDGGRQVPAACPACRLFGWVGKGSAYRSRVRFGEFDLADPPDSAVQVLGLPALFPPRIQRPRARKFYLHRPSVERGPVPAEVVRPGAAFTGQVWFEGLDQQELALLAFALGLDGTFQPKVGRGKSAFLGSVRVELEQALLRRGQKEAELDLRGLAASYGQGDRPVADAVARLRELWSWANPRGQAWPPPQSFQGSPRGGGHR